MGGGRAWGRAPMMAMAMMVFAGEARVGRGCCRSGEEGGGGRRLGAGSGREEGSHGPCAILGGAPGGGGRHGRAPGRIRRRGRHTVRSRKVGCPGRSGGFGLGEENQKNRAQSASRRRGAPSAWVGRPSLCCACCGAERAGGTGGGDARRLPPEEARWEGGWGEGARGAAAAAAAANARTRFPRGAPPRNASERPCPACSSAQHQRHPRAVRPPSALALLSPARPRRALWAACAACTGAGAQAQAPAAPTGPLLRPRRGASARKGPQKYAPGRAANGPRGRGQIESDPRETNGGFGAFRARSLRIFSPAPPAPRCAARGRLTATENRTAARARAKTRGRPNRARRSNRIRERNLFAE